MSKLGERLIQAAREGRAIARGDAKRRFLPPWSVEEQNACYVVRDRDGQQLAYVYFEDEPGRRSAAKFLLLSSKKNMTVPVALAQFQKAESAEKPDFELLSAL